MRDFTASGEKVFEQQLNFRKLAEDVKIYFRGRRKYTHHNNNNNDNDNNNEQQKTATQHNIIRCGDCAVFQSRMRRCKIYNNKLFNSPTRCVRNK